MSDQKPMARMIMGPLGESTVIVLLNGHIFKLPSKHVNPQIGAAPKLH